MHRSHGSSAVVDKPRFLKNCLEKANLAIVIIDESIKHVYTVYISLSFYKGMGPQLTFGWMMPIFFVKLQL